MLLHFEERIADDISLFSVSSFIIFAAADAIIFATADAIISCRRFSRHFSALLILSPLSRLLPPCHFAIADTLSCFFDADVCRISPRHSIVTAILRHHRLPLRAADGHFFERYCLPLFALIFADDAEPPLMRSLPC